MKKAFVLVPAFAAVAMIFTGCAMCTAPVDISCAEPTHETNKKITPESFVFRAPAIAESKDVFRPVFRAGDKRVTATGSGTSLQEATYDALMNLKKLAACDYIVAVNADVCKSTHPTWRFFATTNYTVTISGLPIYLDKLVREEAKVVPPPTKKDDAPPPPPALTKDDIAAIVRAEFVNNKKNEPAANLGLLKLSDINVQISAKGHTSDNVGVTFPAKK